MDQTNTQGAKRSHSPPSPSDVKVAPEFIVVNADCWHVADLLNDIRPADRAEWFAATGGPIETLLQASVETTRFARAVVLKEPPEEPGTCPPNYTTLVIYGVNDWGDYGLGWLVAANKAVPLGYAMHRTVWRGVLETVHERWPKLKAYSDCRNTLHHLWMLRLGFNLIDKVDQYGAKGFPFYVFEKDSREMTKGATFRLSKKGSTARKIGCA